jgi:Flp pilus assembly protein TadG
MMRTILFGALRARRGTMAIETALIAPLLATLALGSFDVSMMVAREQQLQSAANEATEIVLAAAGGSGVSSTDLEQILESSLNLGSNQVQLTPLYRCGTGATSSAAPTCTGGNQLYSYIKLTLTGTYTPVWTSFGVGQPVDFNIVRTVQVS